MIRPSPRYAELAAATNFSFLRGASHPEEMVARAAELGLAGLGIADRNSLAGVVRAHGFARENRRGAGGDARGHRRAARLPRRLARHARLSPRPRRLRPALPAADDGQPARAEGRMLARSRRPARPSARGLQRCRRHWRRKGPGPLGGRWRRLRRPAVDRRQPGYGADMRGALAQRAALARKLGAPLLADQRRADARARAAAARRRRRLHPRRRDARRPRGGCAGQRRAASQGAAEMARLFAEAPEAVEASAALPRRPALLARRTRASTIPRNCARASLRRRPRWRRSPRPARASAIPRRAGDASRRRWRTSSR